GVRPQPAHGALAIFQGRRDWGLARKPVIDRCGDESQRGEVDDVARYRMLSRGEARLITLQPSSPVDDHDGRPGLAASVFRQGEIQAPLPARPLAVGEVSD